MARSREEPTSRRPRPPRRWVEHTAHAQQRPHERHRGPEPHAGSRCRPNRQQREGARDQHRPDRLSEAQDASIVADIDTGFGNAVNVAYAVPRYAAAGAAAVVMEDKTFPKDSSLRVGGRQDLVPAGEFQGKVAAARAMGRSTLVIARTEALIAGLGQAEALRRGEAYAEAGADAVLIHSKQKTPDEIIAFYRAWAGRVPLVLVPTSYPQLSFADVASLGKVGLVICGNHAIRAAVGAMRATFARILAEGGIAGVEGDIAAVADVFALQGDGHMRELEKTYMRDR